MTTTHAIAGGNKLRLHVEESGNPNGKPLLFIHGYSQCRLSWSRQTQSDLARDFRLVTMDIRGHGLSEKPPDEYGDPRLWAEDVNAVIATLGMREPVLVGWSYGGVIISDYVAVHGEAAIAGTVWVDGVSRLGEPLVKDGFLGGDFLALIPGLFSDDEAVSTETLRHFLRLCVHDEPSTEELDFLLAFNTIVPPHVRRGLFARNVDNDETVRRMRKPMVIMQGEADQIVSPRMSAHLQELAPHATVSLYPNVGHAPFWEAPARFNRELREFRNRV